MRKVYVTAPLTIAMALALAACDDPGANGTDGDNGDAASMASPTGVADPGGDPTSDGDDGTTLSLTGADCVTGAWLLDGDSWVAAVSGDFAAAGGTLESMEGDVVLTLHDGGEFTTSYDTWTITMSMEQGTSVIERDGTDGGNWATVGDMLELEETTSDSVVTSFLEMNGDRREMGSGAGAVGAFESFPYECTGNTLTALTDDGTFLLTRVQ